MFAKQVNCFDDLPQGPLKEDNDNHKQVKSVFCSENNLESHLLGVLQQLRTLCFVPVVCQCMPTHFGASTHRLVV